MYSDSFENLHIQFQYMKSTYKKESVKINKRLSLFTVFVTCSHLPYMFISIILRSLDKIKGLDKCIGK